MFKVSTTNTHESFGAVATICSMWLAKSISVRVGPIVVVHEVLVLALAVDGVERVIANHR